MDAWLCRSRCEWPVQMSRQAEAEALRSEVERSGGESEEMDWTLVLSAICVCVKGGH